MVKIFSSGKIVRLSSNYDLFEPHPGSIQLSVSSAAELNDFYGELILSKDIKELWFFHKDPEVLLGWFKSLFKIVEAAGGLVKNAGGAYLFILRNGKWDLPKGKIEKGESQELAAVREVEEECGIRGLSIIKALDPTFHTYVMDEKKILKPTYWFEMSCSDASDLVPQAEEGITDVKWISPENLAAVRANTYESILDVIKGI